MTFSAGAAVVNSGNITGTGGTAINVASAAGEVTVDQNAGTITGAIKLISTDDTLNVSGGTINGNIVGRGIGGGGTINFTLGAGNTFTYAAAYGFSGFDQVNFNSGTVVLNGVNSAANIAVGSRSAARWPAPAPIDPLAVTINAGGTLAPGLPGGYGTLNITGNLAFASGSYYAIDIAPGAGNNSKAALIGAATLGGNGTVEVTPQLGHYAAGTDYQILTTTSALTGTFAGLTVNGGHTFAASLDYTTNAPNDVDLDIMTSGYSLLTAPAGLNQNQQNVLNGINNAILQGDSIPTGFFNLGGLSGAALEQCAHPARRPAGDRGADQRVPVDDGLYESVVRSVERRWRQPDRRRRAGFCAGAGGEPAVGYRAGLCVDPDKNAAHNKASTSAGSPGVRPMAAPPNSTAIPWSAPAMSPRAITALPPAWITAPRRIRFTALRSPAAAPIGAWREISAPGGATASRLGVPRHHPLGAVVSLRCACLRQSLVHHQPHRESATAHREIRRPELRGARRSGLSLRRAGHRKLSA